MPKLAQKMFKDVLTLPELRALAVRGIGLDDRESILYTNTELCKFIVDNQNTFCSDDVYVPKLAKPTEHHPDGVFRDGILAYLADVQAYGAGTLKTKPEWSLAKYLGEDPPYHKPPVAEVPHIEEEVNVVKENTPEPEETSATFLALREKLQASGKEVYPVRPEVTPQAQVKLTERVERLEESSSEILREVKKLNSALTDTMLEIRKQQRRLETLLGSLIDDAGESEE